MKKSRLGQNFLFDPSIARRIVDAAGIGHDDTVVEIGPGYGTMTRILAEKVRKLIAIELDTRLCQKLSDELRSFGNTEIVNMDVMKYDFSALGPFKVVANIPYYITTPIIFMLIDQGRHLDAMTLTIQKEVAERIVADPGGKEYGVLSLMVQYYGNARMLFQIPAGAFTPRPKVDSAVISIERHRKPPVDLRDPELFKRAVKTAFAGRRKMIGNTLKVLYPGIKSLLDAVAIDPKRRPETLTMAEFAAIANRMTEGVGD